MAKTAIFKNPASLENMISEALFLHAGSAAAAVIYFRKDIIRLLFSLKNHPEKNTSDWKLICFLIISTMISGILGLFLLKTVSNTLAGNTASSQIVLFFIGTCLLITGGLQLIKKTAGQRTVNNLTIKDSLLLGVVQAFAVLPGLSRSGLTVAALLLRKYTGPDAIRISFLMSIPIILIGNIVMNIKGNAFHIEHLVGMGCSFLFSILTIHILIKAAQKINFGIFVLLMGLIIIISAFIPSL